MAFVARTLIGANLSKPHTSKSLENTPYLVICTFDSITDCGH